MFGHIHSRIYMNLLIFLEKLGMNCFSRWDAVKFNVDSQTALIYFSAIIFTRLRRRRICFGGFTSYESLGE